MFVLFGRRVQVVGEGSPMGLGQGVKLAKIQVLMEVFVKWLSINSKIRPCRPIKESLNLIQAPHT